MVPRGAFQAEVERNRRALADPIDDHENRDRANLAARILGDDVHAYLDMEKGFWSFYGPDGPVGDIPVDGIWGSR